jgi:hypothetical protein
LSLVLCCLCPCSYTCLCLCHFCSGEHQSPYHHCRPCTFLPKDISRGSATVRLRRSLPSSSRDFHLAVRIWTLRLPHQVSSGNQGSWRSDIL